MLDELLEKCFKEDGASSDVDTGKIKTDVMSRIEREKPMKHFNIKLTVIAGVIVAAGVMTAVFTVSASVDEKAADESYRLSESSIRVDPVAESYYGKELATELQRLDNIRSDNQEKYIDGIISDAERRGEIAIEKELDETDVVGFVPGVKCCTFGAWEGDSEEEQLEWVRKIEEEPETLGLIPAGKSEIFQGGYRIVNRHFINTNEPIDGEKIYYSFRRVYTDDEENRLIASTYKGYRFYLGSDEEKYQYNSDYAKVVLSVFLDHTEDGCEYYDTSTALISDDGGSGSYGRNMPTYYMTWDRRGLKPNSESAPYAGSVRLESMIYVNKDDGVQLLD